MALLDQLMETMLGSSSVKSLSNISGADNNQVQQVLTSALPTLVQSMQQNASTKSGESSLSTALSDHAKDDTSDIASFLNNVDLQDGAKIMTHIMGGNKGNLENSIAQKSGIDAGQIGTILAAAAPLLLSLLGNKQNETQSNSNSGGGIFDILTSALFGSGNNNSNGNDTGSVVGDLLGSLLGGNNSSSNDTGSVVGDLLGSLLGGNTKKTSAKKTGSKKTTRKTTTRKKK